MFNRGVGEVAVELRAKVWEREAMTIGLLIFLAVLAALPKTLRELPGIIDALGRYRLAVAAAARSRGEKSIPSKRTASK